MIDNFLEHSYSGGTDGEQMLAEAIHVLQKGTYEMADVLIVSEKTLGTRFYGLKIGHYGVKGYKLIMDKIWEV